MKSNIHVDIYTYTYIYITRYYGISEILPITTIIDTGNSCAEKTTLEARCSIIYKCFVILMLTWTEYDINAPICMLSGLRVRITADGKGRYTLLLGFPLFIIFEAQNGCFMEKSFRSYTFYRFAQQH